MTAAVKRLRSKAPALQVPQSAPEADLMIVELGQKLRELEAIDAALKEQTAQAKQAAENVASPVIERVKLLRQQIQAYADARRSELTQDGRSKQVETPAGLFGWRTRPPSVKLTAKIEEVVAWLKGSNLGAKFLRAKHEPDKEAMLKEPELAVSVPGVTIVRDVEDFYIEPAGLKLAEAAP